MINRRLFLSTLSSGIFAPVIVTASSLMPVKALLLPGDPGFTAGGSTFVLVDVDINGRYLLREVPHTAILGYGQRFLSNEQKNILRRNRSLLHPGNLKAFGATLMLEKEVHALGIKEEEMHKTTTLEEINRQRIDEANARCEKYDF